jgi:hypothetical protein
MGKTRRHEHRIPIPILLLALSVLAAGLTRASETGRELFRDDFDGDLHQWVVEQMPGGTVVLKDGALVIEDAGGCTVWFRQKLVAPVVISYEATVVSRGGAHDRVSDLNCFWMARDPKAAAACPFAPGRGRSGRFSDYDSLLTHYVGFGGNDNATTRYRRYDGTAARPLLPEHDLRDARFRLEPNKAYRIRLVARDGVAEFWRDGEKILSFRDPAPLNEGWFAFRTVSSHLEIRRFRVERPAADAVTARASPREPSLPRREAPPRTLLLSAPALLSAHAYLAPYVEAARAWPRDDLHPADRSQLLPLLAQYLQRQDAADLRKLYARFAADVEPDARWRLLLFTTPGPAQ